jgi:Ca2+-binding EF-hand superfamily protein
MRLVPGPRIIANILKEAGGDRMDYAGFRAMRLERRKCELNVLAEFKKFDIDNQKKGLLTKKSLRKVLTFEGFSQGEVEEIAQSYMCLDHNKDGYVTYKDLYDYIMAELQPEWRDWLDRK